MVRLTACRTVGICQEGRRSGCWDYEVGWNYFGGFEATEETNRTDRIASGLCSYACYRSWQHE